MQQMGNEANQALPPTSCLRLPHILNSVGILKPLHPTCHHRGAGEWPNCAGSSLRLVLYSNVCVRPAMATADQLTRPILMRKQQRGYGRCDYERFDHITTSHVNAGRGKIGEVEVDCRFFFTKSRWGYLGSDYGSEGTPGGIIYLDLDFHQPSDCRLRAATVVVTLTDHDNEHQRPVTHPTSRPVKFTSHYGPRHMRGAERAMQKRTIKQFTPHVEVMGQGAGGLGVNKERLLITTSRWNFSGHLGSTKGSNWDNQLKWVLEENFHEKQSMHSNVIHTGFAFEHNASRFFMTVEVTGKLVRTRDQLRQSLRFKHGEKAVTIKFEWKNGYSCPALLDNIARDLHLAMEHENRRSIPAEIPDALPVDFTEATTSTLRPWAAQTTPPTPRPSLGADVRQGTQIGAPISIPRIADPSHAVPEPSDDMMRLAAGITPITLPEPSESFSPGPPPTFSGDETVEDPVASLRMRRARSRSYQPSHLSASTTLVGEDEEQQPKKPLDPWHVLVLAWFGNMGFFLLEFMASMFGFPLEVGLNRRVVCRTVKQTKAVDVPPTETMEDSGAETEYSPTIVCSSPGRGGRNMSESKAGESEDTKVSLGVSTPMRVALSEMSELGNRAAKGRQS